MKKTADEWFQEGDALYQKGEFAEAIKHFDKVLKLDSKYLPAYRAKAKSLSGLGKYKEEQKWWTKALKVDPNYKFAHNGLGFNYLNLGDIDSDLTKYNKALTNYSKALTFFEKAISVDPNFPWAHYGQANVFRRLGRFQEALEGYDKAIELDPTFGDPYHGKANTFIRLEKPEEAVDLYEKCLKLLPKNLMTLCAIANLLSKLGRTKEALAYLRKAEELIQSGYIDADLNPIHKKLIMETLKKITDLDKIEAQTEEVIKQQDQQNPFVQKLVENIRNLQKEKEQVTTKLISDMDNQNNDDLVKELARLKEEFIEMKQELMDVKKDVKQIKAQLEDVKEELNNKLDDFRKKLDNELAKTDISVEDQTKLKDYFNSFLETFSSTHVTSQVIDSGQVQLDSDISKATVLSVVASFTPFIGSVLSIGVKSIGDFLQSKEMRTNARKMKGLASDASRLSQIIGGAAYKIVLDKEKQQQILSVTNEDLKKVSGNIFEKLFKFCEKLGEQIDCYLYTNLYQTASARLGHNDANKLIELWLKGKIDPYSVQDDMAKKGISMKDENNEDVNPVSGAPDETQSTSANRSACCNMF